MFPDTVSTVDAYPSNAVLLHQVANQKSSPTTL